MLIHQEEIDLLVNLCGAADPGVAKWCLRELHDYAWVADPDPIPSS